MSTLEIFVVLIVVDGSLLIEQIRFCQNLK